MASRVLLSNLPLKAAITSFDRQNRAVYIALSSLLALRIASRMSKALHEW